LPVDRQHCLP
jgi:hypothetical protein